MAETAIYIILTFCGFLIGVVSTLLMVVFRMNTRISKVEANQNNFRDNQDKWVSNISKWVSKISCSVDEVIKQNTTLIAELQACRKR